jgi:hypothetical protein
MNLKQWSRTRMEQLKQESKDVETLVQQLDQLQEQCPLTESEQQ